MELRATISNNRKDINLMNPKVLLRNIEILIEGTPNEIFRDHCWVTITPEIELFLGTLNNGKEASITFTAREMAYLKQGTIKSKTLKRIKGIQVA